MTAFPNTYQVRHQVTDDRQHPPCAWCDADTDSSGRLAVIAYEAGKPVAEAPRGRLCPDCTARSHDLEADAR